MFKSLIAFCLSRRAIVVAGLLLFAVAGLVAFKLLNIEAYPNPTPVILEITAQAPGLSAEEMERYYTRPMEIGLYSTPGIEVIRSTSFYGLSFVRVSFKYGVDYFFAYSQASVAMTQNVSLPGNLVPTIQANSSTGEIYRYQVVGPPHFGIINLRTVQDWIVARRLLTIPGIAAVNSWGGPTKEFEVEVDPHKLEAYSVTVPQILTALGNANINVGGREIRIGQQSINIRGVGLIDDGGSDDLTEGYSVNDIENVVLSQENGVPVLMKDVGTVQVGYRPRLGILGRDQHDDVVGAIVVQRRTEKTADMIPKVQEAIDTLNRDGSLPRGVRVVPFYDRSSLVAITTHTVLHNLIFGCVLVFLIQWIFLGNLRSAVIVGLNIPFALFFATILLVIMGESANLLSVGAVDFGIIVDSAVILVENIFSNFQRDPQTEQVLLQRLTRGYWGPDPTAPIQAPESGPAFRWTDRLRLILISALQVDKAVLFSALITVAGFVPLFTMQGVEGQIFGPMARTYGYALAGALIATFTVTPVIASILIPQRVKEAETFVVHLLHRLYDPDPALYAEKPLPGGRIGTGLIPGHVLLYRAAAGQRVSSAPGGRQLLDSRLHAHHALAPGRRGGRAKNARDPPAPPRSSYRGIAARAAGRRQRCLAIFQRRVVRAAQTFRRMAQGADQGPAHRTHSTGVSERAAGSHLQFLAIHRGQHRGRNLGRQRRQLGQDRRSQPGRIDQARRTGPRSDEPGSRRRRSRHFPGSRPAQPEHQSGSREGRALRPQYRRCELSRLSEAIEHAIT